jgi:Tol biopolymer transport system component
MRQDAPGWLPQPPTARGRREQFASVRAVRRVNGTRLRLGVATAAFLLACTSIPGPEAPRRAPDPRSTREQAGAQATVDGRAVFVRDAGVVLLEGGAHRVLFRAPPGGGVKDPVWSPDGARVAFTYAPPRGSPTPGAPAGSANDLFISDLMTIGADGSNHRVAVAHDKPGAILDTPAWGADGQALFFGYYAPVYQRETMVGAVGEVRRRDLSSGATVTIARDGRSPGAAPDGRTLAYVGERGAGPSLRVVGADGAGDRELVPPGAFVALDAPRFSPDGETIAFAAAVPGRSMASDEHSAAPFARLGGLLTPAAAFAHGDPWEIWTVRLAGGPPRRLTWIDEDSPTAAWSTDGARLLVQGEGGIHVVDVATGQSRRVSTAGAHGGIDWRT